MDGWRVEISLQSGAERGLVAFGVPRPSLWAQALRSLLMCTLNVPSGSVMLHQLIVLTCTASSATLRT